MITKLLEGNTSVSHLEDLSPDILIRVLDKFKDLRISQKLDGASLRVGLDLDGKLYTSREHKGGERFYKGLAFSTRIAFEGFKSASLAIWSVDSIFKSFLKPGQEINLEIILDAQPNTVFYGSSGFSYISLLEPSAGDDPSNPIDRKEIHELYLMLSNKKIDVTSNFSNTTDGTQIIKQPQINSWKFIESDVLDSSEFNNEKINELISKVKQYVYANNKFAMNKGEVLKNLDVIISKEDWLKEESQKQKEKLRTLVLELKIELLRISSKSKPIIKKNISDDKNVFSGNEGLIFKDDESDEIFKVVDRDNFTEVNKFYHEVRSKVSGRILTSKTDLSLESQGGIYGSTLSRCYKLFGIPGVANLKSKSLQEYTVNGKLSEKLLEPVFKDFQFESYKKKCGAIILNGIHMLEDLRENFSKNPPTLKLKDQIIKYTPEVNRRTLMVFAEAETKFKNKLMNIRAAETISKLFICILEE